jgi:transcriptional regulator with XRE-family HTH domain
MGTAKLDKAITDADVAELATAVQRNITLGPRRKFDMAKALSLRIREKLTYPEIAQRLGVTESTVQVQLHKFLKFIEDPGELAAYRENKSDLLEAMELKLLYFLQDRMLALNPRDGVKDISQALKVVAELKRLEAGQSTSNVSIFLKSIEEAHAPEPVVDAVEVTCLEQPNSSGTTNPTEPSLISSPSAQSPDEIVKTP